MLNDFEMIIHKLPKKDLVIYPISDVHLGAAEHMTREWELFCRQIQEEKNSYIFLVGDLINNALKSSVSNIYEETIRPSEQKRLMVKMLEPIKDKILCAVTGNHERRSLRDVDDDPTYDIMCKLDLEHLYRENIAFVKIGFDGIKGREHRMPSYVFVVTHGSGGGVLTGAGVNRNERFAYTIDGMDCMVVGHTHKPYVTQPNKILIDTHNNQVTFKPFKVVSSTSWLNYGGYAVQKQLLPSSHAAQKIILSAKEKKLKVIM